MTLDMFGRILVGAFGDRVIIGFLMGFFNGVTPDRAYEYIRDDIELGYWIKEEDWERYKKMAKRAKVQAHVDEITKDRVIAELRKHRPDLLGVLINHPGGLDWLDKQITRLKTKMELE